MKKIFLILIFMCHIQQVWAEERRSCVAAALILPLLGGRNDTPIIPVKVNGRDVAMYVSPAFFGGLYLRESQDFTLRPGRIRGRITENAGHTVPAEISFLDSLEIGGAKVDSPQFIRMPGVVTQTIDGKPLVGVIGDSILSNFQVLIDMPHARLALLKISRDDSCTDVEKKLLGDKVYSLPMRGDRWKIPVKIDGIEKLFSLDPDTGVTVVPLGWTIIPELNQNAVAKGERVMIRYTSSLGDGVMGRKVIVHDMHVSDDELPETSVIVQDGTGDAVIGTPFFENHQVLIDYERKIVFFSDSRNLMKSSGNNLHFAQIFSGLSEVKE